jgi:hypothetical protein
LQWRRWEVSVVEGWAWRRELSSPPPFSAPALVGQDGELSHRRASWSSMGLGHTIGVDTRGGERVAGDEWGGDGERGGGRWALAVR